MRRNTKENIMMICRWIAVLGSLILVTSCEQIGSLLQGQSSHGSQQTSVDPPPFQGDLFFSYNFDESSGITAIDSSGNNCDGTLNGAGKVVGKTGSGVNFPIDGAHIDIASKFGDLALSGYLSQFAIVLSLFPYQVSLQNTYCLIGGYNNHELSLEINSGKIVLKCDGITYLTSVSTITVNSWKSVIVNFDGNQMKLYIDGILEDTHNGTLLTQNTSGVSYSVGAREVYLGGNPIIGYTDTYSGVIDNLAWYRRALSNQEIQTLSSQ
jgi:hypothetical protein